jgi:hypothetical protein
MSKSKKISSYILVVVDGDGFSDDSDEPLAGKRLDPVATPCVEEISVQGKD